MLQIEDNPDKKNIAAKSKESAAKNNDMQLVALNNNHEFHDTGSEISNQTLSIANSNKSDLHDVLVNLPENWLQLDFKHKKSCLLSSIYSTCVTKAISHLEALQNCIENWIGNVEKAKALPESALSAESTKRLLEYVRKRNSICYRNDLKAYEPYNKSSLLLNEKLNLMNKPLALLEDVAAVIKPLDLVVEEKLEPIEDIKMGGILEELLILFVRLETDRRRTEAKLQNEKENFIRLKSHIENISYKRAVDLPAKVQQEHDACIMDITELNWHISFNIKSETKLKRKVEVEQKVYEKLKEEIAAINQTVPLIEEKCQIEAVLLQKILDAQADVDELVKKAQDKYDATMEKSRQAHQKAEKERANILADIAQCKRELNKARKRLHEAEEAAASNLKVLEESQIKMSDNTTQERKEMSRKGQLKQKNEKLNDQNNFVQTERIRVEKDMQRVEVENKELLQRVTERKAKLTEELNALSDTLKGKEEKLDKIVKKIKEKEVNIDETNNHLNSVHKNIEKDSRNRDRILFERENLEQELKQSQINYQEAMLNHEDIKNDNKKEKKKMELKEEALHKQIADVKKQVSEERAISGTLQGRMKADLEEFERARLDAEKKKLIFETNKAELDKRLSELEQKVNEIEQRKIALENLVDSLKNNIETTQNGHVALETKLTNRIAELEPMHSNNFIDYDKNKKKLEFMRSHTNEMNSKMKDMNDSINLMKSSIDKLNIEIDILNDTYKEYTIQLVTIVDLDKKSQKSLGEQIERIEQSETSHASLIEERTDYLEKLKEQLESNLDLNSELAARYREVKYDLYNHKLDTMRKIEIKLDNLVRVKDKRQLIVLRERMHTALKDYYNYKIENSENNLGQLNVRREEIADKLDSIEEMLQASVNHITRYLHKQIDFQQLSRSAMRKVYKQELVDQQQREQLDELKELEETSKTSLNKPSNLSQKSVTFTANLIDVN